MKSTPVLTIIGVALLATAGVLTCPPWSQASEPRAAETKDGAKVPGEAKGKTTVPQAQVDHVAAALKAVEAARKAVDEGKKEEALKELAGAREHLAAVQSWMARAAGSSLPPKVGEKAPDFTLETLDHKSVQLSELTSDGPVVLVVLRGWPGYQCPVCTKQVGGFVARSEDFRAAKARIVLVYPGPAERLAAHAQDFASGKGIPAEFSFVIDPDFTFTKGYGLRWNVGRETAYPATFVIDRQRTVRFAKVSKSHGNRASAADVLKALAEIKKQVLNPTDKPALKMPLLTDAEKQIILKKGTEQPFTGKYWNTFEKGAYVCRQCGVPLYLSDDKFKSSCGWPSFDDEIAGAVKRQRDADQSRTEILCAACDGHLGHVFLGERLTTKNTRHCVNSASMTFVPEAQWTFQKALFAGGCFWGVERHFERTKGVLKVTSGYTGGKTEKPTYRAICTGKTGHAEAVEVLFDPAQVTYEQLARLFFEIHDPTTLNRQGPDAGTQYRSAIFYLNAEQKKIAEQLIGLLEDKDYKVVTEVTAATPFWPAEDYHQDYLAKHPGRPDCHVRVPRFDKPAAAK